MEKVRVLVTGGAGFIGSNFCNINKDKFEIVALDNFAMGDVENIIDRETVKFFEGDACKKEDLQKCGDKFDFVLHLAGTSTAPRFFGEGFVDGYVNSIQSFVQTLEFARLSGAKKFLYASTSSLYGNNPDPLTEDQRVTPPNHYAVTKFLYENCARCYNEEYPEMEIVGFRFMSVYGPNEEAKGPFANIVSQFIWDISRGKKPIIYGDGTQDRDFTNVKDVVQGITLAIETEKKLGNEVFNIGTGEHASLNEILEIIGVEMKKLGKTSVQDVVRNLILAMEKNEKLGNENLKIETGEQASLEKILEIIGEEMKKIEKVLVEVEYIENPIKKGYVKSQHADIDKIKNTLGFVPSVKLADGIRDQIANIRMEKIRKTSSDLLRESR
jgi:UDP-glucose 4-epimerase